MLIFGKGKKTDFEACVVYLEKIILVSIEVTIFLVKKKKKIFKK